MQNKKETVLVNVAGVVSPLAGATVTVLTNPGATPATLFSDNGVTGIANPLTTDANGAYSFYAADGRYTVSIVKTGYTTITRDVILDDPSDVNTVRVVTAVSPNDAVPLQQAQAMVAAASTTVTPEITAAAYTQLVTDYDLLVNFAGTVTLTLLNPASYAGRHLTIRTYQAQTVNSASANISINGVVGSAILFAAVGKWAVLKSDGVNWEVLINN